MTISNQENPHGRKRSPRQNAAEAGLLASSGFLLARLGMESRRRFAELMGSHGLAMHHFGLLAALGQRGSLPQRELIRIMGVDPRNATAIVDELEEKGLTTRRQDAQDRRRCNVAITSDGNKVVQQIRRDGARMERKFFQSLDISERSMLHTLLLKLYQGLDSEK